MRVDYCRKLLNVFLSGHLGYQLVLSRIRDMEPQYLNNAIREFYEENPLNITKIVEVAHELSVSWFFIHL